MFHGLFVYYGQCASDEWASGTCSSESEIAYGYWGTWIFSSESGIAYEWWRTVSLETGTWICARDLRFYACEQRSYMP